MRLVSAIAFIVFGGFVGLLFVKAIDSTFSGFVLLIVALLVTALLYLLLFDTLYKLIKPGRKRSYSSSSESKEYIFGITFVISAAIVTSADSYLADSHSEMTDSVISKRLLTRRSTIICHEITLKSDLNQCVGPQCWHAIKEGSKITIKPRNGLLNLAKLNVPCTVEKH